MSPHSKLDDNQRAAVDLALESGQLKGYKNVAEVEKERNIGASLIAKEKEAKADPFKTATKGIFPFTGEGVERSDLELVGDVAGSGAVYRSVRWPDCSASAAASASACERDPGDTTTSVTPRATRAPINDRANSVAGDVMTPGA